MTNTISDTGFGPFMRCLYEFIEATKSMIMQCKVNDGLFLGNTVRDIIRQNLNRCMNVIRSRTYFSQENMC